MALEYQADVLGLPSDAIGQSHDDTRTELLQTVFRRFLAAQEFRKPLDYKNDEHYRLYRAWQEEGHFLWEHNLAMPKAFELVESLVPQIIDAVYDDDEFIQVIGKGIEDEPYAANVQAVLQDQIKHDMRIQEQSISFTKACAIFGYGGMKCTWKEQREKVPVIAGFGRDESGRVRAIRESADVIVHDAPALDVIDPYDLYLDPRARGPNPADMHYIIQRSLRPKNDLYAMAKQGIATGIERIIKQQGTYTDTSGTYSSRYAYNDLTSPWHNSSRDKIELIEVLEYWGKLPAKWVTEEPELYTESPDEEIESVVCIVNRRWIVRREPTPFWHRKKPFLIGNWWQSNTHPYGIGLVETVRPLCEQLNDIHNQYADNKENAANGMWKYREHANIDVRLLVSRPNGAIPVKDMDDVEPVMIPDTTSGLVQYMALLEQTMDKAVGATDAIVGFAREKNETASRSYIKKQGGDIRIKYIISNIQWQVVQPLAEMVFELNGQFPREEYLVRRLGAKANEWPRYTAQDLWTYKFDFRPQSTLAEYGSKNVLIQQYMTYLNVAINHPNSVPDELLKLGAKLLMPKYADKLVRDDNTLELIEIGKAQRETLMYRQFGMPFNFKAVDNHGLHILIHSSQGVGDMNELVHIGMHHNAALRDQETLPHGNKGLAMTPPSQEPGNRLVAEGSPEMEAQADTMRQVQEA